MAQTSSHDSSGRRRRLLQNLAVAAGAAVLAVLIAEGALRILNIGYPRFTQYDADLGKSLRPGAEGWFRREGRAWVHINSDGLRDREHPRTPPPRTVRVAIVGDSFTEALHVDLEEAYWWVSQEQMNSCPQFAGRTVEFINFGLGGTGTSQHLLMLEKKVTAYAPHLVILAMHTYTDIRDNVPELNLRPLQPYYSLHDGELVLDTSFRQDPHVRFALSPWGRALYWINDRSYLIQVLRRGRWQMQMRRRQYERLQVLHEEDRLPDDVLALIGTGAMVYVPPQPGDDWDRAWRLTEALVARFHQRVAEVGAQFLLVTLSNAQQDHPDPDHRARDKELLGVDDLFYPERRLRRLAATEGFPVLTLAPEFQAYADAQGVYLHGFPNTEMGTGHWNADGHRLAGEILARELCGGMVPGL